MSNKVYIVTVFDAKEFRVILVTYDKEKAMAQVTLLHEDDEYKYRKSTVGMSSHEVVD